jgi:hypothetical protein
VRAEQHDLLRAVRARNLADHIGGAFGGQVARRRPESQPHGFAGSTELAFERIGVGVGDRECRYARRIGRVTQTAGVREAQVARAHRADHDADRAEFGSRGRAERAHAHGAGIARAIASAVHAQVEKDDLSLRRIRGQGGERIEVLDQDGFGFEAFGGCTDAAA